MRILYKNFVNMGNFGEFNLEICQKILEAKLYRVNLKKA